MKIITLEEKEFDNYASKHRYRNYYQSSAYGKVMINFGYNVHYLGIIDESEKLIGASLLLYKEVFMNNKYAYAPRGILFDFENSFLIKEFSTKLKTLLSKQGFMYLKMDPYIPAYIRDSNGKILKMNSDLNIIMANLKNADFEYKGKNLYFENEKARFESLVLLNKNIKELYQNFDKNIRHKIRKAIRYGVEIYQDKDLDVSSLYNFIKSKYSRPLDYYKKLCTEFKDDVCLYYAVLNTETFVINSKRAYEDELERNDNLALAIQKTGATTEQRKILNMKMESDKLINTYKNDMILATKLLKENPKGLIIGGCLAIIYDNAAYLIIEGFNQEHKNLNSNYLLKWKMIEDFNNLGYKYFNLNAVAGEFTDKNKYQGLNEMKLGYNSIVTEYIGEFEIVLNQLSYNLYKSLNKRK